MSIFLIKGGHDDIPSPAQPVTIFSGDAPYSSMMVQTPMYGDYPLSIQQGPTVGQYNRRM
jgi:hypothetical protein